MATDTKQTKAIHLYIPAAGVQRIEIERETIRTYENGDQWPVRGSDKRIQRKLAESADTPLPGGPVTFATYGELFDFLCNACGAEIEAEHDARVAERVRERLRLEAESKPEPDPA